ncbi:MAG TPA: LamG domain-containing protein [Phycisphaerae bacterium]|nr:LamG domain-containing protein [Phycisphaerae bacterium]HRR84558.1 LamG domain-containing protein [Phycisphaerae bacterium]
MPKLFTLLTAVVSITFATSASADVDAWYPFENNVDDATENGYNGTIIGSPAYAAGVVGQAFDFNGTDNRVEFPGAPGSVGTTVTVACWINSDQQLKRWVVSNMAVGGWGLKLQDNGAFGLVLQTTAGKKTLNTANGVWTAGVWQHWACTFDGAVAKTYKNGVLISTVSSGLAPLSHSSSGVMTVGQEPGDPAGYYDGKLDELAIWNRVLDAGEIAELYARGVAWPISVTPGLNQNLTALQEGTSPGPIAYTVANGDGLGSHTADIAEVDANGALFDYDWLSLSASQLTVAAHGQEVVTATIDVNPGGTPLSDGLHTAYIKFTDDRSPEPYEIIRQIDLTIIGCRVDATPHAAARAYVLGSNDPVDTVVFTVSNPGKDNVSYDIEKVTPCAWLTIDKSTVGPLNNGDSDTVTATIDPSGLALGTYSCDLCFVTAACSPSDQENARVWLDVVSPSSIISVPGLRAYYRLDDQTVDSSGHEYHGIPVGTIGFADNPLNGTRGLFLPNPLDQIGDSITVPPEAGAVNTALTLAFFIKPTVVKESWLIQRGFWGAKMTTNSPLTFRFYDTGGARKNVTTTTASQLDTLQHWIVVYTDEGNGTVRWYLNGVLDKEATGLGIMQNPTAVTEMTIGSFTSNAPADEFAGLLDEVMIFDKALNASQALDVYSCGARAVWADADQDKDVDQADFARFQACMTEVSLPEGREPCRCFDRDRNGTVDMVDFGEFEKCATGPGIAVDPANPPSDCSL